MKNIQKWVSILDNILISFIILVICLVISILNLHRSFIFGFTFGIFSLLSMQFWKKINSKIFIMICLFLFFLLLALSLLVKTDSTLGRMLIYKVSFQMFIANWETGVGIGRFKIEYGLYQACYFAIGNYSPKEFLLADNTYFAFNDYWQFVVETGILGGLTLLLSFIAITKIAFNAFIKQPIPKVMLAISLMVSIAVAAFFTHVFEKPVFIFLMVSVILYLVVINARGKLSLKASLVLAFSVFIVVFGTTNLNYFLNFRSYAKLVKARNLLSSGYISEGISVYKAIFPSLKNDVSFLEAYAEELKVNGVKNDALTLLLYTSKKRTSNRLYRDIGNLFFKTHQFEKAEKAYLISLNMVPNRFVTRNELMEFYIKTNQMSKAKLQARRILIMPIKVNSNTVSMIKRNAKSILCRKTTNN